MLLLHLKGGNVEPFTRLFLMSVRTSLRDIFHFVKDKKRVYIYGAGHYGLLCHMLLKLHDIEIEGFLTTKHDKKSFLGFPVTIFDDVLPRLNGDDGILVALNDKNSEEVLPLLLENKLNIKRISKCVFGFMENNNIYNSYPELRRFSRHYAVKSDVVIKDWNNILIIRLDRMGDVIWTSAFIRELRRNFPTSKITILIDKSNKMLMENCPYVDGVLCFDEGIEEDGMHYWELFYIIEKFAKEYLKNENYDVVFLPRGLMRPDMLSNVFFAIHSCAKVRIANWFYIKGKIGKRFRSSVNCLFSYIAEHEDNKHEVSKILDMLRNIGCDVNGEETEIWNQDDSQISIPYEEDIKNAISRRERIIALGITGRDRCRSWNPYKFKSLVESLSKTYRVTFLICGDKSAVANAKIISKENCIDLTGKTNLKQMMHIMASIDMYVGADTGLMHMAAALRKPVVEISIHLPWGDKNGLSSPFRCGPWKTNSIIIQPEEPMDEICAEKGYCVNSKPHCINTITVKRVQVAVENMIDEVQKNQS